MGTVPNRLSVFSLCGIPRYEVFLANLLRKFKFHKPDKNNRYAT